MSTTSRTRLSVVSPAPQQRWHPRTLVLGAIAAASMTAGLIHLAVVPEHLEEWWVYGAFFVATGVFQLGFAVPVVRRRLTPAVALTGIVVNLGIVLTWVLSRTIGLPLTPPEDAAAHEVSHTVESAHGIEAVGAADLVATGAELVAVCLLVTLLPHRLRQVTVDALLVTGIVLWVLRVSGALG